MNHMDLYKQTCMDCSKLITKNYSTSFTLGIRTLHKRFHSPIYAIYGFVRYADEIVDTFHSYDKSKLLDQFELDTYAAIQAGSSLNPVLQSFQSVVRQYRIEHELIDAFLKSMRMDLHYSEYNESMYDEYIYGSAEVVGLMCLRVFCEGDTRMYEKLKPAARSLGSAFQKVNFLRDIQSDFKERGRVYFPGVDFTSFTNEAKLQIEKDIQEDFDKAYEGIIRLPEGARRGVYLAYVYYINLFNKIQRLPASRIMNERVRVPDKKKIALLVKTIFRHQLNFL